MGLAVIPAHIALVDESGQVSIEELQSLSGALNEQISRDFSHVWGCKGTVGAYASAPQHTWAVKIQTQLDQPGALGYHSDDRNQPFAFVEYTSDYTVTASHEILEMLADPWGNHLHAAALVDGINPDQVGLSNVKFPRVNYLLEVCDPPESTNYVVGGHQLSDFLLPAWYYGAPQPGQHYTFAGGCTSPRQVADGGYVSFETPDGNWWQVFNQGGQLSLQNLGNNTSEYKSLREFTDAKAREYRASWR